MWTSDLVPGEGCAGERGSVFGAEESRNKALKEILENTQSLYKNSERESSAVARWRGVARKNYQKGR